MTVDKERHRMTPRPPLFPSNSEVEYQTHDILKENICDWSKDAILSSAR